MEATEIHHDRSGLSNWDGRVIERHEILLDDIDVTKNTWLQVVRKKLMLDHISSLVFWEYPKVKRDKGIT